VYRLGRIAQRDTGRRKDMRYVDHEKLDVYPESLSFVEWVGRFLEDHPGRLAARDHLDRASTSVVLNIAEGNGKFSIKDRCRFLDIAYGSGVECAGCLDIYVARQCALPSDVEDGKDRLRRIVSMLIKLKGSLLSRVSEDTAEYNVD
jgi:four helix bundle protein